MYSVPVPDFISNNRNRNKALKMLKQKVVLINQSNAESVSIACNTAHVLLSKLQVVSKVPFVSMIEEVAKKVNKDGRKKIGLLGTPSTIKYGLYQNVLQKYAISTEIPSQKQMKILEKIIRNVLSGKILKGDTRQLEKIANDLKERGAEAIILGCTELPLVFPKEYPLTIYNCLEILAMALLSKYYKKP